MKLLHLLFLGTVLSSLRSYVLYVAAVRVFLQGSIFYLQTMSLAISPDKPHRKASNSCRQIYRELISCYKKSPCMQNPENTFEQCFHSENVKDVGADCILSRKAYAQCRRNLLNPMKKLKGNPYSG
ncbi:hypothetical protein IE077_001196 [Cardiosporidium cionae]|uniref:Cytochrome c oxidase assembly factor 5 n=1 Tax=Cardiosporidium cionae TaxID=476202 RepID=A0ABQ7J5P7_9APIC|nr:hypothetical protein IE077_001196 [Cardiosporidium cionae]|eukprot:KAF8819313.1 hypothetical protein IE077_001196 [Cardiosporidium cionae]